MAYFQNIPNATACFSLKLLRAFLTSDKLIILDGKKNIHDNNETLRGAEEEEEKIETFLNNIPHSPTELLFMCNKNLLSPAVVNPGTNNATKTTTTKKVLHNFLNPLVSLGLGI